MAEGDGSACAQPTTNATSAASVLQNPKMPVPTPMPFWQLRSPRRVDRWMSVCSCVSEVSALTTTLVQMPVALASHASHAVPPTTRALQPASSAFHANVLVPLPVTAVPFASVAVYA